MSEQEGQSKLPGFEDEGEIPDLSQGLEKETEVLDSLDDETQKESESLTKQEVLELQKKEEQVKGRRQDRQERKRYADRIYNLVRWWLLFIGGILLLQGMSDEFHLPQSVLIALIGGTTANVLGIFYFVAEYLFPTD